MTPLPASIHCSPRRRGMALVIVLSAMALLMVLVLALLATSATETRSAAAFSKAVEARTLADLPVNIVMAQVRKATTGLGAERAWTSQPGMIRVFGTEPGGNGRSKLVKAWKLYSADEMVAGPDFDAAVEADSVSDWNLHPAQFTDLNQPVTVAEPGGTVRRVHPILDPGALGKIEGFGVAGGGAPGGTAEQPVPMPVRWLYVLQDGRLVLPQSGTGGKATFDSGAVTLENPIVGRIAFWTDDETCKLNINTASEGTPWDTPRAAGWTERNYAEKIPAASEFQRFPGHPATTCLSTVLQAFDDRYKPQAPAINSGGNVGNPQYTTLLRDIYALLPRTNFGSETTVESSRGGSVQVPGSLHTGLPIKRERLFATVDEFFFNSDRTSNGAGPTGAPPLDAADLQVGRFFLTAHSRAPETNLFNRPRLSLWPLQADPAKRNAMDKLIAFCTTASQRTPGQPGGQEHGFQRASVWVNVANPGSAQSTTADYLLPHNQRTFAYLQDLTSRNIPGFPEASFADKYDPQNRCQILLGMFDLQRWGVNSWYSHFDTSKNKIDAAKSYYFTPPRAVSGLNGSYVGEAMALPLAATATPRDPQPTGNGIKTFGRFPTVGEVVVVFMATTVAGEDGKPLTSSDAALGNKRKALDNENNFTGAKTADHWADDTLTMRAFVFLQPYTPVVGMPPYTANVRHVIEGLDAWTADGVPLGFPDKTKALNRMWAPGGGTANEGGHATAYTGLTSQFLKDSTAKTIGVGDETKNYAFVGSVVPVSGKKEFAFSGGPLKIKIYSGFGPKPGPNDKPVQEINLNFPPTTLRVPRLGKDFNNRWKGKADKGRWPTVWQNGKSGWLTPLLSLQQRFNMVRERLDSYPYPLQATQTDPDTKLQVPSWEDGKAPDPLLPDKLVQAKETGGTGRQIIIGWADTVRSVALDPNGPSKGDFRILASLPVVTADYYVPHPDYHTTAKDEAQSVRFAGLAYQGHYGNQVGQRDYGRLHVSNVSGKLLKDQWFWQDCQPAVPRGLNGAWKTDTNPPRPGDWDNGVGRIEDGPYVNKPDEGGLDTGSGGYFGRAGFTEEKGRTYSPNRQICSAVAFGSLPTGVHGTGQSSGLPRPWQTLLFCPNPPSRSAPSQDEPTEEDHFGFKMPRDHLFLDLFWMPIVEPYAISEPFSTAGKVNLNHGMLPFSYIRRATGIHAVLRSVRINALPPKIAHAGNSAKNDQAHAKSGTTAECYKSWSDWLKYETAYEVNAPETVKELQRRFDQGDVFRSPSEICDIYLVPKLLTGKTQADYTPGSKPPPTTYDQMTGWWNGELTRQDDGFELTGDNTRESPYNQIYPRLTTRSNTFQVHYRVQILKKARSTASAEWDEGRDQVAAELRGSTLFERYLDPNDRALPNFLANPDAAGALDDHYRFRIIRQKHFAP